MKIDFHVHTSFSCDSIIRPADLASKSSRLGIIPAISDHNSIAAHKLMRSLGAPFIPANEIRTSKGDLTGIYLTEEIRKGLSPLETLDKIHEQGGIAYLPHMFDSGRKGISDPELASKADIIEVFNSRCLDQEFNRKAKAFAEKNNKLQAAGSDSHFLFEFGKTYTELPEFDLENPGELLKALKKAKHKKVKAPFFVRGTTTVLMVFKKLLFH